MTRALHDAAVEAGDRSPLVVTPTFAKILKEAGLWNDRDFVVNQPLLHDAAPVWPPVNDEST